MQTSIRAGDTEVFLSELDILVDEYIRDLNDETISKPSTFLGILKYVYERKFKPLEKLQYNRNTLLASAEDVSNLWDWYAATCYRFGRTPTILQFQILSGIERHSLQDWRDGSTRKASPEYSTVSQKMKREAEAALESKAIESNGIGAIFGLKASHNWTEAVPSIPAESTPIAHDTAEQIAERHQAAAIPQRPVLELEGVTE